MSNRNDALHRHVLEQLNATGGGATTAQLAAWGLDRSGVARMLRRGLIRRTRRGHYAVSLSPCGPTDRWRDARAHHLREVAAVASPETVAGFRSAALAWGLPVYAVPRVPEVIRPPGSGTWPGVRVARRGLQPSDVQLLHGMPVTDLERTCVDLACDLPTPEALVTLDAAIRLGASLELMLEILRGMGPTRGCRSARRTLDWTDGHSESPLESRGRGELMLQGIPRPHSNVTFRLGERVVRPDHWWEELGIVGEADGQVKYDGDSAPVNPVWQERLRQEWLEEDLGLLVVRYIDREIRLTPHSVAERWRRRQALRALQPWQPPSQLEIVQQPLPHSGHAARWFRRRHEG